MKFLFFVSLLTFFATGCSKKEEPQVASQDTTPSLRDSSIRPMPTASEGDERIPPHARRAVAGRDLNLFKDHKTAAEIFITLPDSAMPVPIPPGLRPFSNLKYKGRNGNMILYSITTGLGRSGELALGGFPFESDTLWLPMHIVPQ